jgi:hypothetical protein
MKRGSGDFNEFYYCKIMEFLNPLKKQENQQPDVKRTWRFGHVGIGPEEVMIFENRPNR